MDKHIRPAQLAFALLPLITVLLFASETLWARPVGQPRRGQSAQFVLTGSTTRVFQASGRGYCYGSNPQQVLLSDGRVLATDGVHADLYDPKLGSFRATGSPNPPLEGPTAVALLNGTVLITGIAFDFLGNVISAELYDPATGTFSRTGNMVNPSECTTGVRLQNGRVLIMRGDNSNDGFAPDGDAELYEPATGTFSVTGSTLTALYAFTVTLLTNGKVLFAGGDSNWDGVFTSTDETVIFNPETGGFDSGPTLKTARECHTATLLPNGKVLIAGGANVDNSAGLGELDSAELYDPTTNSISLVKASMTAKRSCATATLLKNGLVLIAGGQGVSPDEDTDTAFNSITSSAELFDPRDNTFHDAGDMVYGRVAASSTLLFDSSVLITGGLSIAPRSAELYERGNELNRPRPPSP